MLRFSTFTWAAAFGRVIHPPAWNSLPETTNAFGGDGMEDLRKQANDLLCYYGKMQNRLTQAGLSGTESLVTMFQQLQRGLDAVAADELDPAILEVTRLIDSLGRMRADLEVLKQLKSSVSQTEIAVLGEEATENRRMRPNGHA
jgi:hypothetical protein